MSVTGVLNVDSITDLAPEFRIATAGVELDPNLAPVHLQGNTFRFWTRGGTQGLTLSLVFLKETWSYAARQRRGAVQPDRRVRERRRRPCSSSALRTTPGRRS